MFECSLTQNKWKLELISPLVELVSLLIRERQCQIAATARDVSTTNVWHTAGHLVFKVWGQADLFSVVAQCTCQCTAQERVTSSFFHSDVEVSFFAPKVSGNDSYATSSEITDRQYMMILFHEALHRRPYSIQTLSLCIKFPSGVSELMRIEQFTMCKHQHLISSLLNPSGYLCQIYLHILIRSGHRCLNISLKLMKIDVIVI